MMSYKKRASTKLLKLKEIQAQKVASAIVKLKTEEEQKREELAELDNAIAKLVQNKNTFSHQFYEEIKVRNFDNRDMLKLNLELEKFKVNNDELQIKKKALIDEVMLLVEKIKEKQLEYRRLLVKQEKYQLIQVIG